MVATVGRPVGLHGELEVVVHSDDSRRFDVGSVVLVEGDLTPLSVRSRRIRRGRLVVTFAEVIDRDAAEALRGRDLVVPADALRCLAPDEFWDHDLIGSRVVTTSGEDVGEIVAVEHPPANDVLVVRGGAARPGEHLVPLVASIVTNVDPERRIVIIDPIPGLLSPED